MKKKRLGIDPLDWIRDSRSKRSKSSKHSKQRLQGLQSKQGLQELHSKQNRLKTTQEGLATGWTRATFILREEHLENIKTIAYWKRISIKEIIDEALGSYLKGKKIKK